MIRVGDIVTLKPEALKRRTPLMSDWEGKVTDTVDSRGWVKVEWGGVKVCANCGYEIGGPRIWSERQEDLSIQT
jgi:hypothetical protein